jgi:hypothetical protein
MSSEETTDEKLDKGAVAYAEKLKRKEGSGVTINIVGTKPKEETPTKEEFEKQADFEDRMTKFVKELKKQEYEEKALKEAEQEDLDVKFSEKGEKGAGGEVGLRPEDLSREKGGSGQREFSSHEEMIDYLREKARLDPNSLEAQQLKQLFTKVLRGMKEQPQKVLNFDIEGKDTLKKVLDIQNKKWRKQHGYVEGES